MVANFTKQNGTLINGKPYYFSMKRNIIYWEGTQWSYENYDSDSEKFVTKMKVDAKLFIVEKMCKNENQTISWKRYSYELRSVGHRFCKSIKQNDQV